MSQDDSRTRRWRRVEDLFRGALELPEAEREAYLEAACEGDSGLREEVEDLLRSDAEAAEGDFIASAVRAGESLLGQDEGQTLPLRFGKYEVESRLGEGGFGVVYKGLDPQLQRPVAIKACTSFDEGLRKRFYREARIAAGLRHPNITTVHELGVEEGVPFLVQELLDGEDLRQTIRDDRRLPLATIVDVLIQIARGLAHAHQAGVLHRDVKPANVRILPDGTVKLMDFGIAKLLGADTGLTGTGTTLGTVGYLAPEQLRSEAVDERVDVFAFGVVAYELLGGRRPFRGDDFSQVSYQLLYEEPPSLSELCPGCPASLVALVHECLAKDRVGRPGSFGSLAERLANLDLSSQELPGSSATEAPRPTEPPIRSRRRLWSGMALVVGLGGLGWLGSQWPVSEEGGTWSSPPRAPVSEKGGTSSGTSGGDLSAEDGPSSALPVSEEGGTLSSTVSEEGGTVSEEGGTSASTSATGGEDPAPRIPVTETSQEIVTPEDESFPDLGETPFAERVLEVEVAEAGMEPAAADRGARIPEVGSLPPDPQSSTIPDIEPEAPSLRGPAQEEPAAAPVEPGPLAESTASDMRRGDLITGEGAGVEAPRLLERPQPEYPARALRRQIEGQVVVKVLVDETGKVLQAIAPGKDEHGFLAAARRAARGARFEPASRNGVPGRMWINLPFDFTLE